MDAHEQERDAPAPDLIGEALDFEEREVVLRADLCDRDENDQVAVPLRFLMRGPRAPQPGEPVVLVDAGGSCIGRVASVSGWEAHVALDWATWSGAGDPPPRRIPPR